jgi:hypothetical protein
MYNNLYWDAKTKFELNFRDIRRASGLSIATVASENLIEPIRLSKVENHSAQFNHEEFTSLVWYMARIVSIKHIMLEYQLVLRECRKEVIPQKYSIKNGSSYYCKQGHVINKSIRKTIECSLIM